MSDGFAWGVVGALLGAGTMYVLAKEDIYRPNPLRYVVASERDARRLAEKMAIEDYNKVLGRVIRVNRLEGAREFDILHLDGHEIYAEVVWTPKDYILSWSPSRSWLREHDAVGAIEEPRWLVKLVDVTSTSKQVQKLAAELGKPLPFGDVREVWTYGPSIYIRPSAEGFEVTRDFEVDSILRTRSNPTERERKALPFTGGWPCYACDKRAVGYRDRRPEGGSLEYACKRHADPTIRTYEACMYCGGPVRAGSLAIDGSFAHVKCHREASK